MERKEFVKTGLVRLPPGFRFQPTDEELVVQYLRRKALSFPLPAAIIPEIELKKLNPCDFPSGFEEKYFFYLREGRTGKKKKQGRVTSNQGKVLGYWKAVGKEKPVMASTSRGHELVGTKQVMVFHSGNPPHGSKTGWIIHEYSLCNNGVISSSSGVTADEWVVCRIFARRRSMNLKAVRNREHEGEDQARVTCSSSSSSCVTDDVPSEESVNGDEAMSKNSVA